MNKILMKPLKEVYSLSWPILQRRRFSPKFFILTRKKQFLALEKKNCYTFMSKFLALVQNKKQIFQTKIISCNYWKKKEEFLYLFEKLIPYTFAKNRALHLRCILNTAVIYFISANYNFMKHFCFPIFFIIFLHSSSLCFSSSERSLYRSQTYCWFLFFFFFRKTWIPFTKY